MKTPYKIYRKVEGKFIRYYDYKPAKTHYDEKEPDEYIRKDALLEWLKSERKKCESRDTELWQRINTFTDVIDKLNSM